jgi:hypothetical protein
MLTYVLSSQNIPKYTKMLYAKIYAKMFSTPKLVAGHDEVSRGHAGFA